MELQIPEVIRKTVLIGEDLDISRRGKKRLVARSECRFVCDNNEILEKCVAQLRISDEHLRKRPEEMIQWDWQSTFIEREVYSDKPGGIVILGVAWYNEKFFDKKKEAYTDPLHLAKYLDIGFRPGLITVQHWKFLGEGTV